MNICGSTRHPSYDLEQGDRASIVAADIQHSTVAVATHSDSGFRIHVFEVEGLDIVRGRSFEVQGDVTCLTLGALDGQRVVFVGIWRNESPCLAIFAADDAASNVAQLPVVIPCQPSQSDIRLVKSGPALIFHRSHCDGPVGQG